MRTDDRLPMSVRVAAALLFAATALWRYLTFTGFSNDHHVHVALAQQVLLGDRPVRDFADQGWPLMYLLSAAAWRLAGDALGVEWAIAAAGFSLGAACLVVAAYRLSGSLGTAVVVSALSVLVYPRTYSYPKLLLYPAAAWAMLALARRPSGRRLAIMAAIIVVAFLFRHDHGVFIGVGAAVTLAAASWDEGWRRAVARTAALTGLVAALLLPWLLFIALNGGLVAYLRGGIEYSQAEAEATALDELPVLDAAGGMTMPNAEAWLFWLFWTLPLLAGTAAAVRAIRGRRRWQGELAAVAGLLVVTVLVNGSFLRESLQVRLPDAAATAALMAAWVAGLCWTVPWRRRLAQHAFRLCTIAVAAVTLLAISRLAGLADLYDETDLGRGPGRAVEHARGVYELMSSRHRDNESPPSRVSSALMPFMAYVDRCTPASDRLLVTGEFPELLVIAGRRFAGDGVVFGSWYASANNQEQTVQGLLREPPIFVVHAGDDDGFASRFDLIDAFVRSGYELMTEVPVEGSSTIRILVRVDRRPAGTDPETRWPCYR